MKLTLLEAKNSIANLLQMLTSDVRLVDYINQAQRVLLTRGNWAGTITKMQITSTSGVITWPRSVARVDAVAICNAPIPMRNQWYEYLEWYGGIKPNCDDLCNTVNFYDHGYACTITDVIGTDKKLRVKFRNLTADDDKKILFKGKNENGETVYTEYPPASGIFIEGEYLTCDGVSLSETSTQYFSEIESILKEETTGFVDLYELAVDGTERLIGTYEPTETNIEYRRSLVDPLCNAVDITLTALVKRAFIAASADTDYLAIGNLEALKLAVVSIRKAENNLFAEADVYMNGTINPVTRKRQGGAMGELQAEQRLMEGDQSISISCRSHGTADPSLSGIGTMM